VPLAMKFDELRSIGHNIADSLGGGVSFLVHEYELDVFGDASRSPEGFITVNFLTGTSGGGQPSPVLAEAIPKFRDALGTLCEKHGTTAAVFRKLTARYSMGAYGRRVVVTVEDKGGRRSVDEYVGIPARRKKVLDHLGRVRRSQYFRT
jgi:hypothetical protein